jgi:hypothetical protein
LADSIAGNESRARASSGGGEAWLLPLLAAVEQQLPDLTMPQLAQALPALAQLTQCPWPAGQPLLKALLLQLQLLLPGCAGPDLVAAARAATALAGPAVLAQQQAWCDAVLTRLHAVMPTLGPQGLAHAVGIAAAMHTRPYRAWLYALSQRLRVHGRSLSAGQALTILQGLAALGLQLEPEVLHVFVVTARRCMAGLSQQQLLELVAALRSMYPKALPGRTVQQLVEELGRRASFLDLQQQQQWQRQRQGGPVRHQQPL